MLIVDRFGRKFQDRQYQETVEGEIAWADPLHLFPNLQTQYNPSHLVGRKGLRIFDQIRRDDQVKAALMFKKHALISTGWSVLSPPGRPEDWEPTVFVEEQLKDMEGTFGESLLQILTALDYGYSVSEKVFAEDGGQITLEAIKTRSPHSIEFDTDEYGNLMPDGIHQIDRQDGRVQMPREKFVLLQYQKEFGNPYGTSDLDATYKCYSDDTEVLTDVGWKLIKDVIETDRVAILDDGGNLDYAFPSARFSYPYIGQMFHQRGKVIDLLVTPNHRMWVQTKYWKPDDGSFEFIEAKDLPRKVRYKRDAKWHGEEKDYFEIEDGEYPQLYHTKDGTRTLRKRLSGVKIPMDQWLWMFGVWLAEGFIANRKTYEIGFSQKAGKKQDKIAQAIMDCGLKCRQRGNVVYVQMKAICKYFEPLSGALNKYIPAEYKKLSARQIKILLDGMMFGDGRKKNRQYTTASERLADDFHELLLKAGYAGTKAMEQVVDAVANGRFSSRPIYTVSWHVQRVSSSLVNEHVDNREWVPYSGNVYCLEVPHHRLYVRRNGKACWCGNSWWGKDNAYKWMMMLLERHGIPPIFALYDPSSYKGASLTDLRNVIQALQAATYGTIPRRDEKALELWSPELAGQVSSVFVPAMKMLNEDIARSILMPGLMGLTPETATGSLARARVVFDVFILVVDFLRTTVEERVVNEQIINPLVAANFPVDEYPIFQFNPISEDSRDELLKVWAELAGAGAVVNTRDDETHIRQLLEFPERDEEEPEEPEEPDEPDPGLEPDDDGEPQDPDEDGPVRVQQQLTGREPEGEPIRRAETTAEQRANLQQAERQLRRFEERAVSELVATLKAVQKTMIGRLRKSGPSVAVPKVMPAQRSAVRSSMERLVRSAGNLGRSTLRQEVKKFQEPVTVTPDDAIRYLEEKILWITDVLTQQVVDEGREAMLKSIELGESTQQAIERLRAVFEPYIGSRQIQREGQLLSPRRLETIVRTNTTDAYNKGRLVEIMRPEMDDIVEFVQYSAILDTRTTQVCRFLDGKVFRRDDPALQTLSPPNHFQCRSVLVPLTPDIEVDQDDVVTARDAGRASELAGKGFT